MRTLFIIITIGIVSICHSGFDKFIFSPNGKVLLSRNKKQTKFFKAENGELL